MALSFWGHKKNTSFWEVDTSWMIRSGAICWQNLMSFDGGADTDTKLCVGWYPKVKLQHCIARVRIVLRKSKCAMNIFSFRGEGMVQLNERKDTFQYWKYSLEFKVEFRSNNMSCVCEYSLSLYLLPRLLFSFSEASSLLIWWACPEQHISTDSTSWQQLTSMICRCL